MSDLKRKTKRTIAKQRRQLTAAKDEAIVEHFKEWEGRVQETIGDAVNSVTSQVERRVTAQFVWLVIHFHSTCSNRSEMMQRHLFDFS